MHDLTFPSPTPTLALMIQASQDIYLPPLGDLDRCGILKLCLKNLNPVCLLTGLQAIEIEVRPLDLMNGFISVLQQYQTSTTREMRCVWGDFILSGERQSSDTLLWKIQNPDGFVLYDFQASFNDLQDALLKTWESWNKELQPHLQHPILRAAWLALSTPIPLLLSHQNQYYPENYSTHQSFTKNFKALLGCAFPFVQRFSQAKMDSRALFDGPEPDWGAELSLRISQWYLDAKALTHASNCLFFEGHRLFWLAFSPQTGSAYFEDYCLPTHSKQRWSPQSVLDRLAFFGEYNSHFRDGLSLSFGGFNALHPPLNKEGLKRLNQSFLFASVEGSFQLIVKANQRIQVGNTPDCDYALAVLKKTQLKFENKHGDCTLESSVPNSEIYLNQHLLATKVLLQAGDIVDIAGQTFFFLPCDSEG